jgi:molybdopterin molybdotransferase
VPSGCDSVIPVEQITVGGGDAELDDELDIEPWQNVHRRGSDSRQGTLLLTAGIELRAPEIAIAASAGMARVRVSSQPMLAVISTGNELVEPGDPILPHQVRRSNAYAIAAALRRHGFQRVADDHILDDIVDLRHRLKFHLETHDVVILSGGVSMGKLDLVPRALDDLGVRSVFHKVAQRPGKPMWFGVASSGSPVTVATDLTFFMPVRVEVDDWGRAWAVPKPTNGSGDFTALAGTDGFMELPPGPNVYPKGFVARLHRW